MINIKDEQLTSVKTTLVDTGLLFCINREILFPLGLALIHVQAEEDKTGGALLVADLSEDYEEGIVAPVKMIRDFQEKISKVEEIFNTRLRKRKELLGYIVQSLPGETAPTTIKLSRMMDNEPIENDLFPASSEEASSIITTPEEEAKISGESIAERNARIQAAAGEKHKSNEGNHKRAGIPMIGGDEVTPTGRDNSSNISNDMHVRSIATCPHPKNRLERAGGPTGGVTVCLDCGANMEDIKKD